MRVIRTLRWAVLFGLLAMAGGQVPASFFSNLASESTLPVTMIADLSGFYSSKTPSQIGGMCHVTSAATLLEGEAFRATDGGRLQISRGYLYYRHLKNACALALDEKKLAGRKLVHLFNPHKLTKGFLTSLDPGVPEESIQHILDGFGLTEREFPTDAFLEKVASLWKTFAQRREKYVSVAQKIDEKNQGTARSELAEHVEQFSKRELSRFCQELDARFVTSRRAGEYYKTEAGYLAQTGDPLLQRFLRTINTSWLKSESNASLNTMQARLDLLKNKTPFICESPTALSDGTVQPHAAVVVGAAQRSANEEPDFIVIDSNRKGLSTWRMPRCPTMIYLKRAGVEKS